MLVCDSPKTASHRIVAPEQHWIDLPNLGDLSSERDIVMLKREIRQSTAMRAEVAISAVHQCLSQMSRLHGQMLPADEVMRMICVVASAL